MTEQLTENSLRPVACVFCKFITYIEFDLELHLYENHNIRSDSRIEYAIDEGKKLGATLQLDLTQTTSTSKQSLTTPADEEVIRRIQGMKSWSQDRSSSRSTFRPIVSVEEFFSEELSLPLRSHSLEESPCYPIIDFKPAGKHVLYFCEIHSKRKPVNTNLGGNINLASIGHHCRYYNPIEHKTEIISRMVNK
jgi:hypothetical protein